MNVVQLLVSFGGVSQKVIVESKEWYAAICFSAGRKYMEKLSRQKVQPFLSLFCNNNQSQPIIFIPSPWETWHQTWEKIITLSDMMMNAKHHKIVEMKMVPINSMI